MLNFSYQVQNVTSTMIANSSTLSSRCVSIHSPASIGL